MANELEGYICFNVGRVMRRVYEHYDSRLSPFNLTTPQYMVFSALWIGDGITIGELGQRVALDGSTITGILDRMEKNGYVERRPNTEDRRSALVYLTDKARKVGPRIIGFADELDASIRKNFPAQDMAVFERVLRQLSHSQIG
ncbi:MAG: MarR family transcriptional regulator [Dehalococcoidia bacterium]|nr:MarR family transcriptional regulator [Dehalococcoidia bacterium]